MEFFRVLKPGGCLVIGDVLDQTPIQSYFDHVVDKICSTGHKHRFLNRPLIEAYCTKSGFRIERLCEERLPWNFNSAHEAGEYLRTIHDAKDEFEPEYCLAEAQKYLGWSKVGDVCALNWGLFYLKARK